MFTRLPATVVSASLLLGASAALAAEVPQQQVVECSGNASELPLSNENRAYGVKLLWDLNVTLARVQDFRWPWNEPIPRWEGEETFDIGEGYRLTLKLNYMQYSFMGDFRQDRPTFELFARLTYARSATEATRMIVAGATDLPELYDRRHLTLPLSLIDAELESRLYARGILVEHTLGIMVADYWAAIRDFLNAERPDEPVWPRVQELLQPLHRDTFFPFIQLGCSLVSGGSAA